MDELDQSVAVKRRELRDSLERIFHEDTPTAVEMMIAPLWVEFPDRTKDEDRQRFLDALARLPVGRAPRFFTVVNRLTEGQPEGQPAFVLIFMDADAERQSLKRFDTEEAAQE